MSFLYIKKEVGYLTQEKIDFVKLYHAVRKKEDRFLKDEELTNLPFIAKSNPNVREWQLREKSAKRFQSYLKSKDSSLNILDVGCGNGWFTNLIAETSKKNNVIGLDINRVELEQAARVFKKENLQFVYGDIFEIGSKFQNQFDIITLNASIQYFKDFRQVVAQLQLFLKPDSELHIMDSPFYKKEKLSSAKKRTKDYYTGLGFPDMAKHYFHHNIADVSDFEILYNPKQNILKTLLTGKDSPFFWVIKSFL